MSLAKLNKHTVVWDINTEGWTEYKKPGELEEGKHYPIYGCFITPDNGYGEGGVIISDGFFVNTPQGFVSQIKAIREDPESIKLINEGKETFRSEKYVSKKFKNNCVRFILD